MRHNRAPTMVLHMKEGREWRPREIGARSVILYLTRVPQPAACFSLLRPPPSLASPLHPFIDLLYSPDFSLRHSAREYAWVIFSLLFPFPFVFPFLFFSFCTFPFPYSAAPTEPRARQAGRKLRMRKENCIRRGASFRLR